MTHKFGACNNVLKCFWIYLLKIFTKSIKMSLELLEFYQIMICIQNVKGSKLEPFLELLREVQDEYSLF